MASIRPFLLAALSLSLVACGGDDGEGTVIPEGEHYQYVSSKAFVPTNNNQAREFGLDIGSSSGKLDKTVDNQLGMVLGTLATMGFDVQGTINEAVAEGSIILLVDFQTPDPTFMNSSASGLSILLGDTPMPAACNAGETHCNTATPPVCMGCGRHLTGTGAFTIKAGSPNNAAVGGKIINGTFTGGPGNISLQIALGGTDAIQLDLIGARAKASGITTDGITSVILAGALTEADLNAKVIPAIASQIAPVIAEDCNMLSAPPACGCTAGSTGKTVLDLFDGGVPGSAKDCAVSVEEIKQNSLIQSLLAPDVTIDGQKALSLGIKVEAKKATFPAQ
jgi:hypothetical protein